ncbi:unnamed protein product [Dibothriocephalus latus]|uniref:Uncharacterized protein n=1 Tax=Dibothriocephalus latus TaxID=60516 RepID=A0A3P7N0S5_DIBLA|nr:unnamed protein product [Dibothriocephalus latus]
MHKLDRIGVSGNLQKWIQSVLLGRSQTVHAADQQSAEVAFESGVSQGSALGHILFLMYVNDCVRELYCDVTMFADDIKIWNIIRNAADEEPLQYLHQIHPIYMQLTYVDYQRIAAIVANSRVFFAFMTASEIGKGLSWSQHRHLEELETSTTPSSVSKRLYGRYPC